MSETLSVRHAANLHVRALAAEGAAASTVAARRALLRDFLRFARAHRLVDLADLAAQDVEDYQLQLSARLTLRCPTLTLAGLRHRLLALRQFLRWAVRTSRIAGDPTYVIRIPREPKRIPRAVLSLDEAERVLAQPDVRHPLGLRDRALMELLFSSGLRRMEVIALDVWDLDAERGQVLVREGKGRRDRVVPVSARALRWLARYVAQARPTLLRGMATPALFVGARRGRVTRTRLGGRLRGYIEAAGVHKPGACHIWRHTMATLMHDGGADIRDLQQMLGHAELSTTAIYTRVSIGRLADVHKRTHPAGE